MTHKGLFITGTDTDVGKTFVGAALSRYLFDQGIPVSPRKPAESGCEVALSGELIPADASAYFDAVNRSIPLARICPYRFKAALAPSQAAAAEGQVLTLVQLYEACEAENDQEFLQVEGAGGFYSPVADGALNADLASALKLPVLLVAADRLGGMNHILLSLEAIQRRGLECLGVILNEVTPKTATAPDNRQGLQSFTEVPVWQLSHQSDDAEKAAVFAKIAARLKLL